MKELEITCFESVEMVSHESEAGGCGTPVFHPLNTTYLELSHISYASRAGKYVIYESKELCV